MGDPVFTLLNNVLDTICLGHARLNEYDYNNIYRLDMCGAMNIITTI